MKETTYERLQYGTRIVAGIIEKTDKTGRQYYNVFVRWKQGQNKVERTDFTTIYNRELAIENSYNMLEQAGDELTKGV
jgi:hypothetical protein